MDLSGFPTAQEASTPSEVLASQSKMERHQPLQTSHNSDALLHSLLKEPRTVRRSGLTPVQVERKWVISGESKNHLSSLLVKKTRNGQCQSGNSRLASRDKDSDLNNLPIF